MTVEVGYGEWPMWYVRMGYTGYMGMADLVSVIGDTFDAFDAFDRVSVIFSVVAADLLLGRER